MERDRFLLLSVAFHLAASVRRFLGQLINLFTVEQGETPDALRSATNPWKGDVLRGTADRGLWSEVLPWGLLLTRLLPQCYIIESTSEH